MIGVVVAQQTTGRHRADAIAVAVHPLVLRLCRDAVLGEAAAAATASWTPVRREDDKPEMTSANEARFEI